MTAQRQGAIDTGPQQPRYENSEYAAMLRRLVRAAGRRLGEGDPFDLPELLDVERELEAAIAAGVGRLRERGYSWGDIAEATGHTRQAAQQRWGGRR